MTEIIAEVGSVHDGSFGNAKQLIGLVSELEADTIKFQTHIAEAETLPDAPAPPFFKGEPRFDYFKRTAFNVQQWRELKRLAEREGIEFLSSPFSIEAVDLLEKIGIKRYKIPSGEVTNIPFLEVIAKTKKPVLLSSGMSSWPELDLAVETILKKHNKLVILQCTSEYPCPYQQVGLNVMLEMKDRYKLPVGLSDHTMTIYAPIAAVVLGASVIEKHLTFSRKMYGSDARHSLEPHEFTQMIEGIRAVELMIGSKVNKDTSEQFKIMKKVFEKSIIIAEDIPAGAIITKKMLGLKKPGTGIPARRLKEFIGKKVKHELRANTLLKEDDLIA